MWSRITPNKDTFHAVTLKAKKTLEWGLTEIRNKRGNYSKGLLTDAANKFFSFLNNYELVSQNNVQIIFSQIIIYFCNFSSLRFSLRLNISLISSVHRAAGLNRLEDSISLDVFFLAFKTEADILLLAFAMTGVMKKEPAIIIAPGLGFVQKV